MSLNSKLIIKLIGKWCLTKMWLLLYKCEIKYEHKDESLVMFKLLRYSCTVSITDIFLI